jgi:DNA (cytosine-5)-methyltransferase 1
MNLIDNVLLSDILNVSLSTIKAWEKKNKITPCKKSTDGSALYCINELTQFPDIQKMVESKWHNDQQIKPNKVYKAIELFAGGGGMSLGLESVGFEHVTLVENNKDACNTLRTNRTQWNVIEEDVRNVDFTGYENIDLLAGGFNCQSFSYAGNKLGFNDARGLLFFEFTRAIKEIQPKVFLGENVKGLLTNDKGNTIKTVKETLRGLGYTLIEPKLLRAIFYKVPQRRERVFLVGIRNDLIKENCVFNWPEYYHKIFTVRDALFAGELYNTDCPLSDGETYSKMKYSILSQVPEGGNHYNLPEETRKEYLKKSYKASGKQTGIARRLSFSRPSLTILCSPAQKRTERCHPTETRPLTIRESARIQTFPDSWTFVGSKEARYAQIGNAVPVNLVEAIGRRLIALLNCL